MNSNDDDDDDDDRLSDPSTQARYLGIFMFQSLIMHLTIVDGESEDVMIDKVAAVAWFYEESLTEGVGRIIVSLQMKNILNNSYTNDSIFSPNVHDVHYTQSNYQTIC